MWPKLAGLAFIEAALVALLFVPIPTHAVRYDTAEATRGHETEIFWQAKMGLGLLAAIVAFFVIPWLAYRIVRKHKAAQS